MMPYSQAKRVHRRVLANMTAAGTERARGVLYAYHAEKRPGYAAIFKGPPVADGRRPAVPIYIARLDWEVANDIGQVDALIDARTANAIAVLERMREDQP